MEEGIKMSNEDKIISLLTSIQKDVETMKVDIDEIKNNGFHKQQEMNDLKDVKIQKLLESLKRFSTANTPEEQAEIEAFGRFMDAEEERKTQKYALLS